MSRARTAPRVTGRVAAAVALVAGAAALTGPPAAASTAAAPPRCGDTLAASTTLTQDLHCPAGQGLVLADGVTLDLGGHRLTGTQGAPYDVGVRVTGSATVRNGHLGGWSVGVLRPGDQQRPATITVEDVTIDGTTIAIGSYYYSTPVEQTLEVARVTVTDSEQAVTGGWRVLRVTDLTARRVDAGVICSRGTCAVSRSTFEDGDIAVIDDHARLHVQDNRISGFERGVHVASSRPGSVVQRNHVADGGEGIHAAGEVTVRLNVLTRNTTGIITTDPYQLGRVQVLEENVVRANHDGVRADATSTIRGTLAVCNTGRGIYGPGATDRGGNVTIGDGGRPQHVCGTG